LKFVITTRNPKEPNDHLRVEFSAEGVRFAPREHGELIPGHDVAYRLAEVRSGRHVHVAPGEGLVTASVAPLAVENQVDYARPAGITERYVVGDRYVEQLFVLDQPLLLDGDLEVVGQFETALTPVLVDPLKGVRLLDGGVDVLHYSGAVVFDAAGRETPAPLSLDGDRVTITVPGEWLAAATYPVTIDPRLEGGRIEVAYRSLDQDNPAVAYSTKSGQYLVVFGDSGGSGNIRGRYVDAETGQPLGTTGALDMRIAIVQLWYGESVVSGGECKRLSPPVRVVAFGSAPDALLVCHPIRMGWDSGSRHGRPLPARR